MNKKLNNLVKEINKARIEREKELVLGSIDKPALPVKDLAKKLIDQRDFVSRELLTQSLLELYVFNTTVFNIIISDDLKKEIDFDPQYIDECISELACLVYDGGVYRQPTGIFDAWVAGKKKNSTKLSVEDAVQLCYEHMFSSI